jgi:hypothetical protein
LATITLVAINDQGQQDFQYRRLAAADKARSGQNCAREQLTSPSADEPSDDLSQGGFDLLIVSVRRITDGELGTSKRGR